MWRGFLNPRNPDRGSTPEEKSASSAIPEEKSVSTKPEENIVFEPSLGANSVAELAVGKIEPKTKQCSVADSTAEEIEPDPEEISVAESTFGEAETKFGENSVAESKPEEKCAPANPKKTPQRSVKKIRRKMAEQMKALQTKRSQIKGKLTRIWNSFGAGQPDWSQPQLRVHVKNVEKYYGEYDEVHDKIMNLVADEPREVRDAHEGKFIEFESLYNEVLVALETLLDTSTRAGSSRQVVVPGQQGSQQIVIQHQSMRPPLPTFDGRYENWPKFKSMFQDLMRTSHDSDAIKLYHLDKSLVGAAAGIIDVKTIQDNNYQHAWRILEERYENKRLIIDVHIAGILQLKKMAKKSSKELRELIEECSRHVENLRFHEQQLLGVSELFVIHVLSSALDRETRELWEATIERGQLPKYEETLDFLKKRCVVLERCEPTATVASAAKPAVPKALPSTKVSTAATTSSEIRCELCGESHPNYKCSSFRSMSVAERLAKVKEAKVCFNCLRKGHRVSSCTSERTCSTCSEKHHSMLHKETSQSQQQTKSKVEKAVSTPDTKPVVATKPGTNGENVPPPVESKQEATACFSSGMLKSSQQVLLQTAVINVADKDGRFHPCRTLLDTGSQAHILSEAMARTLGLPLVKCNVTVVGANSVRTQATKGVNLSFASRYSEFRDSIPCLLSEKPTGRVPSGRIDTSAWHVPSDIQLADPQFCEPHEIDLVMASNYVWDILRSDKVKLSNPTVMLRETDLGWIVTGTYDSFPQVSCPIFLSNTTLHDPLKDAIEKFWSVEELIDAPSHSNEEEEVEQHFLGTHRRDESGRYVVQLPFKNTVFELDDNRALALKRFHHLERRLSRNPELKQQYAAFIEEYEALGHCKEIFEERDPPDVKKYYMPHHAVIKPSSTSTKLRVVFDASAKSKKHSLNDVLKVGPTVQNDLFCIVLRFRRHLYVFSADAVKMYRQVRVDPMHTPYQRIFWRKEPSERLRVLELTTVTYGTASAPFLATRCLVQLAESVKDRFPASAEIVKNDVYVDDMLSGADTEEEAVKRMQEVKQIMAEGGFLIRKWCSNSEAVLKSVPEEDRERLSKIEEYSANEAIKALGVLWDPKEDEFRFVKWLDEQDPKPITKKKVFSDILKLFDPLGLISPVVVLAKVFMQKLWASKLQWEDELGEELLQEWIQLRDSLLALNHIRIPRCFVVPEAVRFEIHGFADASTVAYGACLYLRCIRGDQSAELRFLCSKSRVAPLKQLTIPRLELLAALLLSKLTDKVINALGLELSRVVLWSDSQIVLAWLRKDYNSLEVYVRNRTMQINHLTDNFTWNYVRTTENPADIVSRGLLPIPLSKNELWWSGPSFLKHDPYEVESSSILKSEELPGIVVTLPASVVIQEMEAFTRYSDFRKLQRVICYVRRFIHNCRAKATGLPKLTSGYLTVPEYRDSLKCIVRVVQTLELPDEFHRSKTNQTSSQLARLAPIVDEDGLLRVGGRLEHSSLPYEAKHPLILPRHHVTETLIRAIHVENLHIGPSGLLAIVRQRFWPLKGRSTVRKITQKCMKCFRARPRGAEQFMGQLPEDRVNVAAPFEYTGVDFAGPVTVKQGKYRPKLVKAYIAVFVCMVTKNFHLELVSDLSSEAFLAALERFINRRGCVRKIFSDNATNFVGTSHLLHELYDLFKSDCLKRGLQDLLLPKEIEWSFIPPRSPNFGGLWEAGVKSVKTHLKRTLQNATLDFEQYCTILTHIEAILNSRPLFSISDSPGDPLPITPAHLQIGRPLRPLPKPSREATADNRLTRWEYLDKLREHFWSRWSREYLTSLQNRMKWTKKSPNLQPGMLVLFIEDNLPPQTWKLGIVVETCPGTDAMVRVVDVKAGSGGVFKRSIRKLAPLPTEDNERLQELFRSSKQQ